MGIIRHASVDDVAAIYAMTQAVYAEYRALLPHSSVWHETPQTVAAEMKLGPIMLSEVDGRVVGSVRCHVEHEEGKGDFMYIHRLAVLPDYRRQGLGCALVQAVEDLSKSLNIHRVRLEMRAAQPENCHFYLKLGYKSGEISTYLPTASDSLVVTSQPWQELHQQWHLAVHPPLPVSGDTGRRQRLPVR